MIYNRENKNILNTKVNSRIDFQYRLLKDIDISNVKDKILDYKNYINDFTLNYKIDGEKKKTHIYIIATEELKKVFAAIDKFGINIKSFVKYVAEEQYIKKSNEDKNINNREYDFTKKDNEVICLEELKSENKLSIIYKAFITQVKFNTVKSDILSFKNEILEEIKKLTLDKKLILYGEIYKTNHIQVRIDKDNTAKEISLILDLYKKLIFYNQSSIISDIMRFKLLKSFYELMDLKKQFNYEVLKKLDYKLYDNFHSNFEDYLNYINKVNKKR